MDRTPQHLHTAAQSEAHTDIEKSSRWSCDIFVGSLEALMAAGTLTASELNPQKDRAEGYTVFLPDGQPCPLSRRAWREPGYKAIRLLEDGTYCVEVTVSKEVQAWRRRAEAAAEHEAEQVRINQELEESGSEYRNRPLEHHFHGHSERWEGTKAQLQAVGIGVGMAFPGEPGAPDELQCKCPLGFDVCVSTSRYDRVKAAAGIYEARSWYTPPQREERQYVQHAPGVLLQVPLSYESRSDTFVGTAEALVNAGLVPTLDYFPGRPGNNVSQAKYRKDWSRAKANWNDWGATIRKRGKAQFEVEIPVSDKERERRVAERKTRETEEKQADAALAQERRRLRQFASNAGKTAEEFRQEQAETAEFSMRCLWREVFGMTDGGMTFDIPEDSELWSELSAAFQTIRDAVQIADIARDNQSKAELKKRLTLASARNDKGLQSLLHNAQHLRLVHSAPDKGRG